jgi:hypothetical protein
MCFFLYINIMVIVYVYMYMYREGLSVDLSHAEAHQTVALQRGVTVDEVSDWAETDTQVRSRQDQLLRIVFERVMSLQSSGPTSTVADVSTTTYATQANNNNVSSISANESIDRTKVLLVSHGGFIRRFISNMCPHGNAKYPAGSLRKINNGSLSVIHVTYRKDGTVESCVLDEVYANYSLHLQNENDIVFT